MIVVATWVTCDSCGVHGPAHQGPSLDRVAARQLANRAGWTIAEGRKGRDLCPRCTEEAS